MYSTVLSCAVMYCTHCIRHATKYVSYDMPGNTMRIAVMKQLYCCNVLYRKYVSYDMLVECLSGVKTKT